MTTIEQPRRIVERMLEARLAWAKDRRRIDGVLCKLPEAEYAEWRAWVKKIDTDLALGHRRSNLDMHAFGMDIIYAPELDVITIEEKT